MVQFWVERIPVRPGEIALVIGRSELNLAVWWNDGLNRSGISASHTDFEWPGSNFDGKRFGCLTAHSDAVIHSDVGHQGSLRVLRPGGEVVDVIENLLFAD